MSSLCTDGRHLPALDIDVPFDQADEVQALIMGAKDSTLSQFNNWMLVRSASGFIHAYASLGRLGYSDLSEYVKAIRSLPDEIVDEAWTSHCELRGQTLLRPAGVPKNPAFARAMNARANEQLSPMPRIVEGC